MPSLLDKIKVSIGAEPPPEERTLPQQLLRTVDEATTLTWRQRIIGFCSCLAIGVFLTFLSMMFLFAPVRFAILYSFGNVCSIASTMFLMGPCKQCKKMMEQGRIIATAVYLGAIIITLVVAFKTGSVILVLVCLFIQFIALCWYCITWIPGGQAFLKGMIFRS